MHFSSPIWDARKNIYTVDIEVAEMERRSQNEPNFVYVEDILYSGSELHLSPDIRESKFNEFIRNFSNEVVNEGKNWFASPIKEGVFLKKLKHTFYNYNKPDTNYSGKVQYKWVPYLLEISQKSFDLYWKASLEKVTDTIIPVDFVDFSEEQKPLRTVIVNGEEKDELVEFDVPFKEEYIGYEMEISSRAIVKKKVREARLKAAIATMKAERLAEKYFRRYGIHTDVDETESELSFDSEEDKNE